MQSTEELSAHVLHLTEKLFNHARSGDFVSLTETLAERDEALRLIEETVSPTGDLQSLSANLVRTKELNVLLENDFSKQQKRLLDEKSALKKGARMRQAYGDVKK